MQYIVMDLEWNSVYGARIRGYLNEIIEIGAVRLNDALQVCDSFSLLVKSKLGKRLQSHVKLLTSLEQTDIDKGCAFVEAAAQFAAWMGAEPHVVLSWGDGDMRVLLANTRYHTGQQLVPYVQAYCDLQAYFHFKTGRPRSQQMGLAAAGEALGLPQDHLVLHRALDDSRCAAEIFKRLFDPTDFAAHARPCHADFFAELAYKPKILSDLENPLVDKTQLCHQCQHCGTQALRQTEWRFASRGFLAEFLCPACGVRARLLVTFKKNYNNVEVKRSCRDLPPAPPEP